MDEVVLALEGVVAPMSCFVDDREEGRVLCSHVDDGHACATRLLWTRVQGGVTRALQQTTLAGARRLLRPRPWRARPSDHVAVRIRGCLNQNRNQMADLEIKNLHVNAGDKQILKGLDLTVRLRRGPRADGSQRLGQVDARQRRSWATPRFEVTEGQILFKGRGHHRGRPRRACAARSLHGIPVPGRDPGRHGRPSTCAW